MADQASRIVDMVRGLLTRWNPSLDVSPGSAIDAQVLAPLGTAIGLDPLTTPAFDFLLDRMRQDYPALALGEADALTDVLLRPVQGLMEPMQREVALAVRAMHPASDTNASLEAAEALASNFFLTRKTGTSTSGRVRIFLRAPAAVTVLTSARFSTPQGRVFVPGATQSFALETVALQRAGSVFYVAVSVVADRVKKIVVEHLGVEAEKVTENASFIDDLGADSLDTVELVMAFEEEFGIEIPDDAAESIQTVGDAVKFIEKSAA